MKKTAFIGAGNMSRSIIIGLIDSGTSPESMMVSNPSPDKRLALSSEFKILETSDNIKASMFANIIVLCVKPHLIAQVCQQITTSIDISDKLFISVAAGCTVEQIQKALNKNAPIVRVMPNTPSQLGLGMSGLFASSEVTENDRITADKLMTSVGKTIWLSSEDKINDIICVAGSAPAYFFLFMEAMEKQAKSLGFTEQESRMLVEQTALGSAQMVMQNNLPLSTLRENVTSKGGATHAAIEQFKHDGLENLVKSAMDAALHRAQEMTKEC